MTENEITVDQPPSRMRRFFSEGWWAIPVIVATLTISPVLYATNIYRPASEIQGYCNNHGFKPLICGFNGQTPSGVYPDPNQ